MIEKTLARAALVVSLAAVAAPAWADGYRRPWRTYPVGTISRDVITPYYFGYYGSRCSYVSPDPVPGPTYVRYAYPPPLCWSPKLGYWIC